MMFKSDENLPSSVTRLLREAGHDVMTVREQGLVGGTDAALIKICTGEQRVLVTEDLDFADIRAFPPEFYAGIVVLRLASPNRNAARDAISAFLVRFATEVSLTGKLVIVEPNRVRIRG